MRGGQEGVEMAEMGRRWPGGSGDGAGMGSLGTHGSTSSDAHSQFLHSRMETQLTPSSDTPRLPNPIIIFWPSIVLIFLTWERIFSGIIGDRGSLELAGRYLGTLYLMDHLFKLSA